MPRRAGEGSIDRTLRVWGEAPLAVRGGAGSNVCAATLQKHTDWLMELAGLPDHRIVSGSFDGTLRVWSECPRVLNGGTDCRQLMGAHLSNCLPPLSAWCLHDATSHTL